MNKNEQKIEKLKKQLDFHTKMENEGRVKSIKLKIDKLKKPHAKCPHCGSEDFFVHEFIYYKAFTDKENKNTINCYTKGNGIDLVQCAKCEEDITEISQTAGIEFNYD